MNDDPTNLDRLHDLVLPPPVSCWPPTPGWAIVLASIGLLGLLLVIRLWIHWQANRYRREALAALKKLPPNEWPALVKRVALSAWPRETVAHLTGEPWLAFLDRSAATDVFSHGAGRKLESLAYHAEPDMSLDELRGVIRRWIQHHRNEDVA